MRTRTLSPKELAKAIGASESSVKRWVDDGLIFAAKTAGGHRRITLSDALDYIRKNRLPVLRADVLGLPVVRGTATAEGETERLLALLRDGRSEAVRAYLLAFFMEGRSVASIFDGPVLGAMRRFGELWLEDERGVFLEHRATAMCAEAIERLRLDLRPDPSGPVAVGGACSGDPSTLPSLMAATVLAAEGFRAINLGADTPASALLQSVDEHGPVLAWVSVNHLKHPESIALQVRELLESLDSRGVHLVLGGRAARRLDLPDHPRLYVAERLGELSALSRGLLGALGSVG